MASFDSLSTLIRSPCRNFLALKTSLSTRQNRRQELCTARDWVEDCVIARHRKCMDRIHAAENMIAALNNKSTENLTINDVKKKFPEVPTNNYIVYLESGMTRFELPHILRTLDVYIGLEEAHFDKYYVTAPAKVITVFFKLLIEKNNNELPDGVIMMVATTATVPLFFIKVGNKDTITHSVNILKATAYDFVSGEFINMLVDISDDVFQSTHMMELYELNKQALECKLLQHNQSITKNKIDHMKEIDKVATATEKLEVDNDIEGMHVNYNQIMKRQHERQNRQFQEHRNLMRIGINGDGGNRRNLAAAAEEPAPAPLNEPYA